MNFKWIGAMLIISGCGAVGFAMANTYRRDEKELRQLIAALDYMACELQYRLTPLPQLCRSAAKDARGCVGHVLGRLAEELEAQTQPDVDGCVRAVLDEALPGRVREAFEMFGASLGRFDLEGQLKGLEAVRSHCRREVDVLASGRDERLRSYQTLGLCTGAALAILFI